MGSRGQSLDVTSHHTAGSKDKKYFRKEALRRKLQTVSITSPQRNKSQQKAKSRRNLLPSVSPPGRNKSNISAVSDSNRTEASCCDDEIIECGPYRPQHHHQQPKQSSFSFGNDSNVSLMSASSRVSFSERGLEDIVTVPEYDHESRRKCFYSDGELEEFRFEWEMERDGLLPTHK